MSESKGSNFPQLLIGVSSILLTTASLAIAVKMEWVLERMHTCRGVGEAFSKSSIRAKISPTSTTDHYIRMLHPRRVNHFGMRYWHNGLASGRSIWMEYISSKVQ